MTYRPNASIEPSLADAPASERFSGVPTKHERVVTLAAIEDGAHGPYDRNAMFAVVLGPLRRQYNLIASNLGPTQRTDFVAAAAGQDQQFNDRGVVV